VRRACRACPSAVTEAAGPASSLLELISPSSLVPTAEQQRSLPNQPRHSLLWRVGRRWGTLAEPLQVLGIQQSSDLL